MVAICLVFFFFFFQYYYTDFSSDGIAQKRRRKICDWFSVELLRSPISYLCYFILVPLPFSFMTCRLSLLLWFLFSCLQMQVLFCLFSSWSPLYLDLFYVHTVINDLLLFLLKILSKYHLWWPSLWWLVQSLFQWEFIIVQWEFIIVPQLRTFLMWSDIVFRYISIIDTIVPSLYNFFFWYMKW